MNCGIQGNFLQDNAYQLVLPRFPKVQYFSTKFVIPEMTLPLANVPTPFTDIPMPGDKPIFQNMQFEFMIDENMTNYLEIYSWIKSIGTAESYDAFINYTNKGTQTEILGEQDAKVIVLSSKGNPVRTFTFKDAFPISLSGIPLDSQQQDTVYARATVVMAYSTFDLL